MSEWLNYSLTNTFMGTFFLLYTCYGKIIEMRNAYVKWCSQKGFLKNEIMLRFAALPQWILYWVILWRQTSLPHTPSDKSWPNGCRNPHWGKFRLLWFIFGFPYSATQSCSMTRFFGRQDPENCKRIGNPPGHFPGRLQPWENALHRYQSGHWPAYVRPQLMVPARSPSWLQQMLSCPSGECGPEYSAWNAPCSAARRRLERTSGWLPSDPAWASEITSFGVTIPRSFRFSNRAR